MLPITLIDEDTPQSRVRYFPGICYGISRRPYIYKSRSSDTILGTPPIHIPKICSSASEIDNYIMLYGFTVYGCNLQGPNKLIIIYINKINLRLCLKY